MQLKMFRGATPLGNFRILARHAFGREVDSLWVQAIQEDRLKELFLGSTRRAATANWLATALKLNSGRVEARVRLTWIGDDHPLSGLRANGMRSRSHSQAGRPPS